MARPRILAVDDEEDILQLVAFNLEREGFDVTCVTTGEDALRHVRKHAPDLVLLDLMLPHVGGIDVCRTLKSDRRTAGVPIVMVTAKGEDADVVLGLELGADDYVTKPFSPRVLVARVRAVLRRRAAAARLREERVLSAHDITLDRATHTVRVGERGVALTATEFELLAHLLAHPGWVFSREQIIVATKGADYPVTDRAVDVQILSLRRKLGDAGRTIETVRGVGYRLRDLP